MLGAGDRRSGLPWAPLSTSSRRGHRVRLGLLAVAVLLAGCGAGDPEVGGVVLDRDDGNDDGAVPVELREGPGGPGVALGFGDDDTATSSTVLDGAAPPLVSDAVQPSDDRVQCTTRIQAPADRPLVATGEVAVTLVVEGRDGTVDRSAPEVVPVDVQVAAGNHVELPGGLVHDFRRDEVAGLHCEARFDPA